MKITHFLCATVLLIFTFLVLYGCGSGTEGGTPEFRLESITDASGNSVTDDATGINPRSFTLLFSQDIDSTICSADDVTASCRYGENDPLTPSFSVAVSESNSKACIVTVDEPWKYALMTCTVTYSSEVSSNISPKATISESLRFTNGCAINDDFNADSRSCWDVAANSTPSDDIDILITDGIVEIDTANSDLILSSNPGAKEDLEAYGLEKAVSNVPSEIEILININVGESSTFNDEEGCGLIFSNSIDAGDTTQTVFLVGMSRLGEITKACSIAFIDSGAFSAVAEDCSSYDEVYVKLTADSDSLTAEWSSDGVNYNEFDGIPEEFPDNLNDLLAIMGDTLYIGMTMRGFGASLVINSAQYSGFEVSGQY